MRPTLALVSGAGLSFLAFGLLWIGTPWRFQALMFIPFFLAAFALSRNASPEDRRRVLITLISGAAPLGGLITLFRDAKDSHLGSILTVCVWAAAILAGCYCAKDRPR